MSKQRRTRAATTAIPAEPLVRDTDSNPARFHSLRACHAQGLRLRDCEQAAAPGSLYCYYHDKLQRGLTEPRNQESYSVWPLPDFPWRPVFTEQRIA